MTALLAGFGRAAAEVGAIIIVGGNIEGFTRTMTTIALETSRGNLSLAIGLGMILIFVVILINALAWATRRAASASRDEAGRTDLRPAHHVHGGGSPRWRGRDPRSCFDQYPARSADRFDRA
jgi:hypothetical protein